MQRRLFLKSLWWQVDGVSKINKVLLAINQNVAQSNQLIDDISKLLKYSVPVTGLISKEVKDKALELADVNHKLTKLFRELANLN